MAEFLCAQPVKIRFGAGEFSLLPDILDEVGARRCVLVCGAHFADEAAQLRARVPAICAVFDAVQPDPQLSGVEDVVALARAENADTLIAVGGGSAIDTAKFAAACASGDLPAQAHYDGAPFPARRLRLIAVPTTAGTGSEVTQVSVISRGSEKKTMNDPAFNPTLALVDPALTVSVPPRTTMVTGLDALAHALEGYWSRNHQPICDLYAIEAVRLILENLERAWRDGQDMEARRGMALGSLLAGLAFAQPKTAGCHACSYPLSSECHLPHGEACAFTLGSFVRINADERLETLCRRAGLRGTEDLAARIAALKTLAGLRTRLGELDAADPAALARIAAAHPLMRNNPVPMDESALTALFAALR